MADNQTQVQPDVGVLLTGFEIFGKHKINPSWETVKKFDGQRIDGRLVAAVQLPVEYAAVDRLVPSLWQRFPNVKLCIHCGVGQPETIKIEELARNSCYEKSDNTSQAPESKTCKLQGEPLIQTSLDCNALVSALCQSFPHTAIRTSSDAGLFLCEYVYYLSLTENRHRALFVHVPPYSQVFGAKLLDDVMRVIIQHALKQIPASQMTSLSLSAAAGKPLRPKVGVAVLVRSASHPGCVLLGKRLTRHSDGNAHGQHTYAAPGGHLEFGESFVECATREVREECHVELRDAHVATTLNVVRKEEDYHYVVIVVTGEIDEEPVAGEADKCASWDWYDWTSGLPSPLFGSLQELLSQGYSPF